MGGPRSLVRCGSIIRLSTDFASVTSQPYVCRDFVIHLLAGLVKRVCVCVCVCFFLGASSRELLSRPCGRILTVHAFAPPEVRFVFGSGESFWCLVQFAINVAIAVGSMVV